MSSLGSSRHVSSCPSFLVLPPLRLFLSCPVILLALVLSPHVLPPLVSSGLVHSGLVPAVSGNLLACCGGLLEASSEPLGGPLGASGRPPGADFGPLDGPCSPWAAPGPVPGRLLSSPGRPGRPPWRLVGLSWTSWAGLGRSWRLLGGPWGPFGASWAALGAPWAAPKSLSAEKPEFVDNIASFEVFEASGSSPGAS